MAIVTPKRIRSVSRLATIHSRIRDPLSLSEFEFRLTNFLKTLDIGKRRHLCISEENLAGLMPGRNGHIDYSSCPSLMVAVKRSVRAVFGPKRHLSFYFSTRDPDEWLLSSYWHNLRTSKLELGFDEYAVKHAKAAEFDAIMKATQDSLQETPVYSSRLEDLTNHPLGPAAPLLSLIPLPQNVITSLSQPERRNVSPNNDAVSEVLKLNREKDDEGWQARKDALIASLK